MNKPRLRQIAKDIEANAGSFGMEQFLHPCGSPSCIAGFAYARYRQPGTSRDDVFEIAADVLGLNIWQARLLFYGRTRATPAHAIRTINHLAATGEVDWSAR